MIDVIDYVSRIMIIYVLLLQSISVVFVTSVFRAPTFFLLNNIFLRDDGEISNNNKKSINQQHNLEFQVSVDKYNKSSTVQL